MLIEERATPDNSFGSSSRDQEEMYGDLEEELINGSEAMNYYKSQNVNANEVEQAKMSYESESMLNDSSFLNDSFSNDSMNLNASFPNASMNLMEDSFKSNASFNDSLGLPTGANPPLN